MMSIFSDLSLWANTVFVALASFLLENLTVLDLNKYNSYNLGQFQPACVQISLKGKKHLKDINYLCDSYNLGKMDLIFDREAEWEAVFGAMTRKATQTSPILHCQEDSLQIGGLEGGQNV